jgi:hypothetical protein
MPFFILSSNPKSKGSTRYRKGKGQEGFCLSLRGFFYSTPDYVSLFQVAMSGRVRRRDAGIGNHVGLFDFFFTSFQRRREKL